MALPISLEQAKAYLRVDGDDEDDLVIRLIAGAFAAIENHCGLVAEYAVREFVFDDFSRREIFIPRQPVDPDSVVVAYTDLSDAEAIVDGVRAVTRWGWTSLLPAVSSVWPKAATGSVVVTVAVGYAEAVAFPADALDAAYMILSARYWNREGGGIPENASAYLDKYCSRSV